MPAQRINKGKYDGDNVGPYTSPVQFLEHARENLLPPGAEQRIAELEQKDSELTEPELNELRGLNLFLKYG